MKLATLQKDIVWTSYLQGNKKIASLFCVSYLW